MSVMIEVLYRLPTDTSKEAQVVTEATKFGGVLTHREHPPAGPSQAICLSVEFKTRQSAERAANNLRLLGFHVEGPMDY